MSQKETSPAENIHKHIEKRKKDYYSKLIEERNKKLQNIRNEDKPNI